MKTFLGILCLTCCVSTGEAQIVSEKPHKNQKFVARFEQLRLTFDRLQDTYPIDKKIKYSGSAGKHLGVPVDDYATTIPIVEDTFYVVYNVDSILDTPLALMVHSAHRTYCHILSRHLSTRSHQEKNLQARVAERCVRTRVGQDAYKAFKHLYRQISDNEDHPLHDWAVQRMSVMVP